MNGIIVVLASWRFTYIADCLKYLSQCDGIDDHVVWIFQDDRIDLPRNRWETHSKVTWTCCEQVTLFKHGRFTSRKPHDWTRTTDAQDRHCCAFNSFWSLREAYEANVPYVYLVADDVFVTSDFLRWHVAVQNDGDYFSTVAERAWTGQAFSYPEPMPHDVEGYYRASTHLMDGGMCWKRENLGKLLRYPSIEVVDHRFPNLPFRERCPMIPFVQRAYHVGRESSYALTEQFAVCGEADEIPKEMPRYEWTKVQLRIP